MTWGRELEGQSAGIGEPSPIYVRRKKEDKGLLGHRVTRGSKAQAAKGAALRAGAHAEAPQLCLWFWVCGRGRTRSLEAHEGK